MKQLGILFKKWINFLVLILDPVFLIVLILTIFSVYFSIELKNQNILSNFLTIVASVLGGISGGIFYGEYNKVSDDNMLRKKGLSAVRNLKTIQEQVFNLKKWIFSFIKSDKSKETICLNEIIRHITTMEMNIVSGYEDWIDLVPELSEAKEKSDEVKEMVEKIYERKIKLTESKDKKDKEKIGKQISLLEKQVRLLKEKNSKAFSLPFSSINSHTLTLDNSRPSFGVDSNALTLDNSNALNKSFLKLGRDPFSGLKNTVGCIPLVDTHFDGLGFNNSDEKNDKK